MQLDTRMMRQLAAQSLLIACLSTMAQAAPRVWIADQGDNQGVNNRILEIDPININPSGPDGSNVYVLNALPSPALAFLDELTLDAQARLWCVVKDTSDQTIDGLRRIDKDTGTVDDPPGLVTVDFPGQSLGGYLEGAAIDDEGYMWVTSIKVDGNNMLTRVNPETGQPVYPFGTGTLINRSWVNIPGNVAQGLLYEPMLSRPGYLWHSDAMSYKIYMLDPLLRLTDGNPGNDDDLAVATFTVPFKPKGMAWMGEMIWVAAPAGPWWNPPEDAGIWEFNPYTGATRQLFNTPTWNLDGIAILSGPFIQASTETIDRSVWLGENLTDDTFTIANGGEDWLDYTLSEDAEWLEVWPESGSSTGEPDEFTITYDISGLPADTYQACITVTAEFAFNSPLDIIVTAIIETVGPDFDGDGDVDQTDFGTLQQCFSGTGVPQTAPECLETHLDGDADVDQEDYQIFEGCMSGTDVSADPSCDD
jgi:hypothetical protein